MLEAWRTIAAAFPAADPRAKAAATITLLYLVGRRVAKPLLSSAAVQRQPDVFVALILVYVAIIGAKIARIGREIGELAAEDDE